MERQYTEEEIRLRRMRRRRAQLRKQRRNRRIVIAVLAVIVIAVVVLIAFLSGAFEKRADSNLLTVKKDGSIVYEEVEPTTKNAKDIKAFAQRQIDAYNKKEGAKDVKLERFSTEDDHIYLRTSYKDAATYTDFTGYELYVGTVSGAKKAGYALDGTYSTVVNSGNKSSIKQASGDAFSGQKLVIIKEWDLTVNVPGKITGVSDASNVNYTRNSDAVRIKKLSDDSPAQQTYIFYK